MAHVDIARAVRLAWGLALIAAPRQIIGLIAEPSDAATTTARVLGVRHLALVPVMGPPGHGARRVLAATIDALHSGSMLLLADADRKQRVLAGTDAALAAGMGALTLLA